VNRQIALIYTVEFLRNFGTFIVGAFAILYLRSLGISIVTIGILYSLKGALDVFFSLPIGYSSDRWGRKPWVILSPSLAILTYWLFIVCVSVPQFVIVFLLWNTSELSWQYSVPMYLNDIVENRERGDALAKMSLMNTIAGMVAPLVAGFAAEVYGMHTIFEMAIVFEGAILGIALYWMRLGFLTAQGSSASQRQISQGEKGTGTGMKRIFCLLKGNIFYFAVAMMAMGFGWAILDVATPLLLKEEMGISYLEFGTILSVISLMGAAAKIGAGRFTDVHGRRPTLLFSTVAAGICMLLIGVIASEVQFVAVRGIGSLFGAVMWIVWMASFHDAIKEKRATTSALIDTLSGVTWTLGSFSAGFIVYVITARRCFLLIGAIYIFTAFLFSRIESIS
jgi:MFS family permease